MKSITGKLPFFIYLNILIVTSCSDNKEENIIEGNVYGITNAGDTIRKYSLENANGVKMEVISYGGIITSLRVPDRSGNVEDVVLGFDSLSGYEGQSSYFGAIIGRYANRIANGRFILDSTEYTLAINNDPNSLHGGPGGFHQVNWKIQELKDQNGLRLFYTSEDMEEGFPGNLDIEVIYILTDDNELEINYSATTDRQTVVNLTQHTYFNLSGNMKQDILDHLLMINADHFLPVDSTLIPTGEFRSVKNTPFDFSDPYKIGGKINADHTQLKLANGFDHCWIINKGDSLNLAATVYHEPTGRFMEVFTTEPGIQLYTGNWLDGSVPGKNGIRYNRRSALCLETQHFPDSPNQPAFPSTVLNPGEKFKSKTIYKFSVK